MSDLTGRFVWYELLTSAPGDAPSFYERVTGWGTAPFEGAGEMPYTMWTAGETPIGGIMELPEEAQRHGAPPHWLAYVVVPDTAAALDRAKSLGARVMVEPMAIPEVGTMAVLADPQGALFAIHTPAAEMPLPDEPPQGHMSWHELATGDPEAAFAFYGELFGWEKGEEHDMGDGGVYQLFRLGARRLGGIYRRPADVPVSHWLLYTRVPDIDAAVAAARAACGRVLNGPMEVPGGTRVAQCTDPAGAAFALHEVPDGYRFTTG